MAEIADRFANLLMLIIGSAHSCKIRLSIHAGPRFNIPFDIKIYKSGWLYRLRILPIAEKSAYFQPSCLVIIVNIIVLILFHI